MKAIIKKILLLFIILICSNKCLAMDSLDVNLGTDYVISTDAAVTATAITNPDLFTVSPFFTIFNEKNILLLHPQKTGTANLILFQESCETTFQIKVKPKSPNTNFTTVKKGAFEFSLLDKPPSLEDMGEKGVK